MANEIWKSIKGYEGKYEISSLGRVKSLVDNHGNKMERIRKARVGKSGYLYLNLWCNSKYETKKVHRLVAETFLPNKEGKPTVNHKNCIKTDNRLENLEWATYSENSKHASENGRLRVQTGDRNHMYGKHGKDNPCSKTLLQKSVEGVIVAIWDNAVIAAEKLGYNRHCLTRCARGERKTAYGYRWEYKGGVCVE